MALHGSVQLAAAPVTAWLQLLTAWLYLKNPSITFMTSIIFGGAGT
eukprot:CAMPEP_0174367048 /NCGR_PEP_ID=MMETSP0811_2-20130205/83600_1 /TAXON_ID=73025 ORGANISM="Eutreptiella gymnastica-like, Strain CCMP1594" /NCGR_SAMPLE_ID=MMETSP0811_2 /ASSEMBLY_ACC=CAM_ASM_000667 /LENGTH=45 /DNA_ID= /DNA_START= /DNA_END= /DNA_ORIENTATION=